MTTATKTKKCVHHWLIETRGEDGYAWGWCILCEDKKRFLNFFPGDAQVNREPNSKCSKGGKTAAKRRANKKFYEEATV